MFSIFNELFGINKMTIFEITKKKKIHTEILL